MVIGRFLGGTEKSLAWVRRFLGLWFLSSLLPHLYALGVGWGAIFFFSTGVLY
jgi:hypothetical protein